MNEQGAKKILFNKSTLLSLKAELLKKQEEVYVKKQLPQNRLENFKPPPAKGKDEENHSKEHKKTFKDRLKAVDIEELEACRKSKLALEKKSELYEHLSDKAGNSELAGKFLVDFNSKKQQEEVAESTSDIAGKEDIQIPENNVGEDEWVEFTDCLGRTRKCHKSDLEMYRKRDKELIRVINKNSKADDKPEDDLRMKDSRKEPEKPFLVQTTNDYLQSLRKKWEEKEQELLAKDKDIHYQDLLFDEARIHGVGYYSFSTNEAERQAQMEELKKQREETLNKQKEAEEVRKQRDALMAARVAAARQRQRERQGLPPLPETEQQPQKDFTTCLLEFLTQQRKEADAKANEAEIKRKEEEEKERQKLRDAYVREWDIGKDGIEGNVKKFREMTQEEYVDQQRAKRIDEFAPPQTATTSKHKNTNTSFDDRGKQITKETPVQNKTWSDVRPVAAPLTSDLYDIPDVPENKGLYFSTAKKDVKYKNFVKSTEPTPILNEVSDEEEEKNKRIDKRKPDKSGAEIEPPATYEYYGPMPKKTKPQNPYKIDVREAYAKGAKSLESKSSNIKLPQHYDFTFD